MADITMCLNRSCPSRSSCYRVSARPGEWQSYSAFQPDEHGRCKHYIKTDKSDTVYSWEESNGK